MLKIFKNKYFLFQSCKNKHKKGMVGKAKKGKVVIVNNWKHRWCKTLKYQLNIEKMVFQELNISNGSIFLIDCQFYTFLLMHIMISDIFIWP